MLEAGHSQWHVAGVLEVSFSTVAMMRERSQLTKMSGLGMVAVVRGSHKDRFIVVQVRRQGLVTDSVLQKDLQNANGVRISKI